MPSNSILKQISTGNMKTGGQKLMSLSYNLPPGSRASGKYVIAVIDTENTVPEENETNNDISSAVQ